MCAHRPLSTVEVRKQNRNRVYRHLITLWEPVTKQELAFRLSMSLPTLSQNLNELAEMGLIDRSATTDSTGGRRPRLIAPLPNARFALGAELTGGDLRLVAVNLRQETVAYQKIILPFSNTAEYGARLAELIEVFLDENHLDRDKLLGVGLTLPGIIGPDQSTIEYAPTIGVHTSTPCRFTSAIPYPTLLDNDANCGGFGEWWNRTDQQSMAYLSLSRGVGGAILVGGQLYDGISHRAAEFGHMCLHPGGRRCECGPPRLSGGLLLRCAHLRRFGRYSGGVLPAPGTEQLSLSGAVEELSGGPGHRSYHHPHDFGLPSDDRGSGLSVSAALPQPAGQAHPGAGPPVRPDRLFHLLPQLQPLHLYWRSHPFSLRFCQSTLSIPPP